MNKIEGLKDALDSIDDSVDTCETHHPLLEDSFNFAEVKRFIILAHNMMPLLLEAVEELQLLKEAVEFTPLGTRGLVAVGRCNALLEKLK